MTYLGGLSRYRTHRPRLPLWLGGLARVWSSSSAGWPATPGR